MFLVRLIFSFFDAVLDRVFSLLGAALFAQIPGFILQYRNALQGALVEAGRSVSSMRSQASLVGKTLDAFIAKHLSSADPDFVASGKIMQETLQRFESYQQALISLQNAGPLEKVFVFFRVMDYSLVRQMHFRPVLPLDPEGVLYALVGLIFGLIFYQGILKLPFHFRTYRISRRKLKEAGYPA